MTKLSQNDFFVAIQGILVAAQEAGWSINQIYDHALEAVEEWDNEVNPFVEDED